MHAQVETAVAQRAERGNLQLASVFGHINMLRALLLGCDPSGAQALLPHAVANTVSWLKQVGQHCELAKTSWPTYELANTMSEAMGWLCNLPQACCLAATQCGTGSLPHALTNKVWEELASGECGCQKWLCRSAIN